MKMKTIEKKSKPLTSEEVEKFGNELEELRKEILQKVGQSDEEYIRKIESAVRYLEIFGRLSLHFGIGPLSYLAGVSSLSLSKILDNMELGHNVMHGQYDWMNDPELNSEKYEWDIVSEKSQWILSHNYFHHSFTNVIGKDYDFGYTIMRLSSDQEWTPANLFQVVLNLLLATFFEFGVAFHGHGIQKEHSLTGAEITKEEKQEADKRLVFKIAKQLGKDYLFFPLLGGLQAPRILLGNFTSNIIRNLWTYSIIFCGHFTEDTVTYPLSTLDNETKGDWYLRQLHGSSNLEGGKVFDLLSGNLSHQIEHHLFPDIPANRYAEVGEKVKQITEKYGQNYNSGSFFSQFTSVIKRIVAFSFPDPIAEKLFNETKAA
jgi:linoleoyl-CoA desaturase